MASRIVGAKEMSRLLKQIPRELQEKVVLAGLRGGANVWRKAAAQNLSSAGVTGRSIGVKQLVVVRRARTSTSKRPRLIVGNHKDAFFLAFREEGTAPHRIAPRPRGGARALADRDTGQFFGSEVMHPGEPARPWLRTAIDANINTAINAIGKALGRSIERAAVKLAGRFAKSGLAARRRR